MPPIRPSDLEGLRPRLRQRYFDAAKDRFVFSKPTFAVRCHLRPARLDPGRADFPTSTCSPAATASCTLNSEVQGRILSRFLFALADQGYLVLGKAEIMLAHISAFTPVDITPARITRNRARVTATGAIT